MTAAFAFLVSAAVVVLAGSRLSREGDAIADRTRLGTAFVGAIIVAAATSLPELATTSFAVTQGSVGLALGDLFGTLMLNMAMLALAALVFTRQDLFHAVGEDAAIPAIVATALCAVASVGIAFGEAPGPAGVGSASLAIGVAYLGGMWVMWKARVGADASGGLGERERDAPGSGDLRPVLIRFAIASAGIVAAAYALALSAREIAAQLGIGESFVGAALVGVVTSLPEATVAFAAFARGAHGIGFGALFGSNAFDVVIVLPLDVLHRPGAMLSAADPGAQVSVLFAALLMSMAVLGLVARGDRRVRGIEPLAVAMLAVYAAGLYLTYRAGM